MTASWVPRQGIYTTRALVRIFDRLSGQVASSNSRCTWVDRKRYYFLMPDDTSSRTLSAAEISNYVVCPEAWRLKYIENARYEHGEGTEESKELREEWVRTHDLSSELREYAKIAYLLLLILTVFVFAWDQVKKFESQVPEGEKKLLHIIDSAKQAIPLEILGLFLVLGILIFVWDLLDRKRKSLRDSAGIDEKTDVIAVRGSSELPGKRYHSAELKLSSRPDALLVEGGIVIPADRKPMTNKVRDRHVIQILVHCRLVENHEGKRPPYGVLFMGKNVRTVRIKNTEEKQLWLDSVLAEMRSILGGVPAVPAPSKMKCKYCDVRQSCDHSRYSPRSDVEEPSDAGEETTAP